MADINLTKIDLFEQTIAQTDTTSINDNYQYDIKDMPVGGITNAQMVLFTQSAHLGLLPVGAVFKCIDSGTYTQGQFYKYTGNSWVEEPARTYETFNSNWVTNGTITQFMQSVENDASATKGMVYLGELTCSDLPFVGNGDAVVEIIDGTGTEKVIVLSLNSGDVAPYYWRYTYWVISGTPHSSGWVSFVPTAVEETYTIASNSWTALSSSEPFTYQTSVYATYTVGGDTEVGIINDQPVLFANYGFIVGNVVGKNVTIYAIAQPDTNVTLKIGYRG